MFSCSTNTGRWSTTLSSAGRRPLERQPDTYTVLFDPGRVKQGILPNEKMGRPLAAGRRYTLVVDDGWQDAAGQKLAAPFRRGFRAGPPADQALDPQAWRIEAPFAQTRDPLRVTFPAPLDHALLQRALTVSLNGERVTGDVQTEAGETRWLFSRPRRGVPGNISCMRHRFSKTSPATASDARSKSRSSPPAASVPKRVQRRCRSACAKPAPLERRNHVDRRNSWRQ